jgi:hypothetical protein
MLHLFKWEKPANKGAIMSNAQQALYDYMDDIRSNFIGGLTLMTPTQSRVLDRLYEQVLNEGGEQ